MHRALKINDILVLICTVLREDTQLASLSALARACFAFKEPAMDALWYELVGLTRLMSIMPRGVITSKPSGFVTINRSPLPDEWLAILRYTRHIHEMRLHHSEALTRVLYSLLTLQPQLFPCLENLEVQTSENHLLDLIPLLVAPFRQLTFTLQFPHSSQEFKAKTEMFFTELVKRASSRLRVLDLTLLYWGSLVSTCYIDSIGIVEGILHKFNNLMEVSINGDSYVLAVTHRLASLPHLTNLKVRVQWLVDVSTHQASNLHPHRYCECKNPFPALKNLIIEWRREDTMAVIGAVLSGCSCFAQKSISIVQGFLPSIYWSPGSINALLSAVIKPSIRPALKNVSIDCFAGKGLSHLRFMETMGVLLELHALVSVKLRCRIFVDVTDSELQEIAAAWPLLEELIFDSSTRDWKDDTPMFMPTATLDGVGYLTRCTHLRRLELFFRAKMTIPRTPFSGRPSCTTLTEMVVGLSPINACHEAHVVNFLEECFPNLTSIRYNTDPEWMHIFELKSRESNIIARWLQVADILHERRSAKDSKLSSIKGG